MPICLACLLIDGPEAALQLAILAPLAGSCWPRVANMASLGAKIALSPYSISCEVMKGYVRTTNL